MAVCPKCKGKKFSPEVLTNPSWNPHVKCLTCETILFVQQTKGWSEHGWCGNPKDHWKEPDKVLLELLQKKAGDKLPEKPKSDIPF